MSEIRDGGPQSAVKILVRILTLYLCGQNCFLSFVNPSTPFIFIVNSCFIIESISKINFDSIKSTELW